MAALVMLLFGIMMQSLAVDWFNLVRVTVFCIQVSPFFYLPIAKCVIFTLSSTIIFTCQLKPCLWLS